MLEIGLKSKLKFNLLYDDNYNFSKFIKNE